MAHSTLEYPLRRGFEALLHPALISFLPPQFLFPLPSWGIPPEYKVGGCGVANPSDPPAKAVEALPIPGH